MTRLVLAIAVAALLVFGLLFWRSSGSDVQPQRGPGTPTPAVPPPAAASVDVASSARGPAEPERVPVGALPTATAREVMASFPQGLRGVVVDARQNPLPGVAVYLLESATNAPLSLPLLLQQGLLMGPVAETRSGPDGAFAIGLQLASDKNFDLRFLSPAHADSSITDLRVLADEWHDVGTVTLAPGLTLHGRVTVEGTATPVPQALVRVVAASAFEDAMLQALPGREQGLAALAEPDGRYTIHNVPATGVVQMSAVAHGFARVVRKDIDLSKAADTEIDFGLPPGLALVGRVVDPAGKPVARAQIEAWPTTAALPACTAVTQTDGAFAVLGLREGKHLVKVRARGFQDVDLRDIVAGRDDVRVTLRPRARLLVRAFTPNGRIVRDYRVGVRRYFAATANTREQVARVVELPDQRARIAPAADAAEIANVPPGTFVVQVTADGLAKSQSMPVTIDETMDAVTVDVALTAGAALVGIVVDEAGQPLAGALVQTQVDGALPDNELWRILRPNAPDQITEARATTGTDGRFALEHLAFGDYQLEITHPDACRAFVTGQKLAQVERRELGSVRLATGTVVFGRATRGGAVHPQIHLVLATAVDPKGPPPDAGSAILVKTVTDSTGAFRFPRRVPPGTYELRAAALDAGNADAQALARMLQLQKNVQPLVIAPGQRQLEHHIDLPPQH